MPLMILAADCAFKLKLFYPFFNSEPLDESASAALLAIWLVDKLSEYDGFYPSISKVLLATIGPYKQHLSVPCGTAYAILRDAVYKELQKFEPLTPRSPKNWQFLFQRMSALTMKRIL